MWLLDIITRILAIISGLVSIYLYLVNRRLSIFKIEEQLEQCQIDKDAVRLQVKIEKGKRLSEIDFPEKKLLVEKDMKKKEEIEIRKIEAREKYLLKMKKFKWLWSKIS